MPIGTVVLLKNSEKRLMIIGFCQKSAGDKDNEVYDYVGCVYPEGHIGPDKTFLFNESQIERVFALGYQDEEQFAFKIRIDAAMEEIRSGKRG